MPEGPSLEFLSRSMEDSPFSALCGLKIVSVDAELGQVVVEMPLKPELERRAGSGQFHGGAIATLIDTAGCYALFAVLKTGVPTINFRTDFLRPAIKTTLWATATIRKSGRTVGVVDVDVHDDAGKLIAVGRGTFGTTTG